MALEFRNFLKCNANLLALSFLADILDHLNQLNLCIQGKGRTVLDLHQCIRTFVAKLELFRKDFGSKKFVHFKNVRGFFPNNLEELDFEKALQGFHNFLQGLQVDFECRFADF